MELKSIEMQVALPRTHDAGKQMQQMQQEGQLVHDHAAAQMEKDLVNKRQHVVGNEQKDLVRLKNEDKNKQSKNKSKKKRQEFKNQKHPYKGNQIDFSG